MTVNVKQWIKAYAITLFYVGLAAAVSASLIWTPLLDYLVLAAMIGGLGLFIITYATGLKRKMVERIENARVYPNRMKRW